jgi:hypothetical protein
MAAWFILVAIIIVCLTILMYTRSTKEGYLSYNDLVQKANPFAAQMKFANANDTYFRDTAQKGIFTNPGLSLAGLNAAVKQPDIYLATTTDRDYNSFFAPDPENAYTEQDKAFCKKALYPLDLPARQKYSTVGCGWYFHPTQQSVGVLGTANGPIFNDGLPGGGTYYWNLTDAALKEDFKKCKRITSCDLIDTPGIKGQCGWCGRLGHAIPVNSSGSEKYPDVVDEDACGENVVNGADNCPKPPPDPVTTPDGEDCGTYGYPSPDNNIRLYNNNDCAALGGNSAGNGECLKPQGGSYSWDCRGLNAPITQKPVPVTACTPDARGRLSRECLIQTALGLGLTKQGSIYKMLNTTNGPNANEQLAIKYLSGAGVAVPNAVLGEGTIDKAGAANVYMSIYNAITTGKTELNRQAAKLLAVGTTEFDPCTLEGSQNGPFDTVCLQRAFRTAGCQPAGAAYPNASNVAAISNMTWDQVNAQFKKTYDNMNNSDAKTQDAAMKDCVGFQYSRKDPPSCTSPGMEYLYYSFNWGDMINFNGQWYAAFMGRKLAASGFEDINVGGGYIPEAGRYDQVAVKIHTSVTSATPINGRIDAWTDDGLRIWVNGQMILNAWWDQAPTYHGAGVNMPANQKNTMEVAWYENGGGALLILRNVMDQINPTCSLPFPKDAPLVAFDFFRGRLDDIHNTLQSRAQNVSVISRGGRQGAYFGENSVVQMFTPFRWKTMKTITFMIWADGRADRVPVMNFATSNNSSDYNRVTITLLKNGLEVKYFRTVQTWFWMAEYGGGASGRWLHFGVQFSPSGKGFTVFADGNPMYTFDPPQNYLIWNTIGDKSQLPDEMMKYNWIGRRSDENGNPWNPTTEALNACLGFVHMYDTKLTPEQMKAEVNYWSHPDYENTSIPTFESNRWNQAGWAQF